MTCPRCLKLNWIIRMIKDGDKIRCPLCGYREELDEQER